MFQVQFLRARSFVGLVGAFVVDGGRLIVSNFLLSCLVAWIDRSVGRVCMCSVVVMWSRSV